jgi:hypothetical protein
VINTSTVMGLDSSAGIATLYGLDGPGIESRWGTRFSAPVQTGSGAHPASYTMGSGSLPGVKRPRRGADHLPQSKRAPILKEEYSYTSAPTLGHRGLFWGDLYLYTSTVTSQGRRYALRSLFSNKHLTVPNMFELRQSNF